MKRIIVVSIAAGTIAALLPWIIGSGGRFWSLLAPEAKVAILVTIATTLALLVFYSIRLILRVRHTKMRPAKAVVQGFGSAGDNLLRGERALFPEKELNQEVWNTVIGISGIPVEEGELHKAMRSRIEWSGFPVHSIELAAGQSSVRAAEQIRKVEIDDYFGVVQKALITTRPSLEIVLFGNGITGLSSAAIFPWDHASNARTHLVWVLSDNEETTAKDFDEETTVKDFDEEDKGERNSTVSEVVAYFPPGEDIGPPAGTIRGRIINRRNGNQHTHSLLEEKLDCMARISERCYGNRHVVVLSENLADRGLDNPMKRRALLTMALTTADEERGSTLVGASDAVSAVGAADPYHLSRYPGIYTHSELRRVTGRNGIMSIVHDLQNSNIVWHLSTFRQDYSYWEKRGVLIAFIVGNPTLVSNAVQSLSDAVSATPVCVTHNVAGCNAAYILLLARLCAKEIAESPFRTFSWEPKESRRQTDGELVSVS